LIDEDRRASEATPAPPAAPTPAQPPVDAEVMNWNLGRGASWKHGQGTDPNEVDEVAHTVAEELPDIVTLQEVYTDYDVGVGTEGSYENDVDRIVRLVEEETGVTYHAARGPATVKAELDDNIWRDGLVGDFGNVVLSREPITDSETRQLPPDGDEGRVTQEVVTTVDGVEVTVVNTHVTTVDERQPDQLDEAFDRAGAPSGPTIFAGDFNAPATETDPYARDEGLSRLTARRGERCDGSGRNAIDQVYGSEGVTGQQRPGFECGPSDHPYQVVDVEIPRD
jgi:endonuclease/exonuclease/phosphatase family metal-dependent hydrolase